MATTALAYPNSPLKPSEPTDQPRLKTVKLWLCAYFPDLALESLNLDLTQAVAVLENVNGRPSLHALSPPARQTGLEIGMTPASALALCPNLAIRERSLETERLALQKLAQAGLAFSPWLSLDRPQSLLLEIGACLKLFGGVENLREQLRQCLLGLHHRPVMVITPSADASFFLAQLGQESLIVDKDALRSALGRLPINALDIDRIIVRRLQRIGLRQLSDLWRLPRDGLARRYGKQLLQGMDTLAGRTDTVPNAYQPAPSFYARLDMPIELERIEHFFPAIAQLAKEFAAFLLKGDSTALGLKLELLHHNRPNTELELDFRAGSRNAGHWLTLLREKLERSPLPAPVIAIGLASTAIVEFQPERFNLFEDEAMGGAGEWQTLLDQLQARLGHSALKHLSLQDDHRPECAMTEQVAHPFRFQNLPKRPLWLLAAPKPINIDKLELQTETERIESGWWDGSPVRRDYRSAKDKRGRKLWVFRDLNANGGWFWHGLFG